MADLPFDPLAGFQAHLGLDWRLLTGERVEVGIEVGDHMKQPYGIVHGGVYCAIVETLCSTGAAMWGYANGIAGVVGTSNSTHFIRAHRDGDLEATATPIHQGRTYQLWEAIISRPTDGKEIARGQLRTQHIDDPSAVGVPRVDR
jgi:uncharacterized protein (TIGR00369 family)